MLDIFSSSWFKTRPAAIQEAVRFRPPGTYRLTTTDQIVEIISYGENDDGSCDTCGVRIYPQDNPGQFMRVALQVFDIKLTDLVALN